MIRCFLVAAVLVAVTSPAALAADCQKFTQALESLDKDASDQDISDVGDDSVYRAILAQEKIADINARRAMNIQIMIASKCPLPSVPVENHRYVSDALKCKNARMQKILDGAKGADLANLPECDQSKWKALY